MWKNTVYVGTGYGVLCWYVLLHLFQSVIHVYLFVWQTGDSVLLCFRIPLQPCGQFCAYYTVQYRDSTVVLLLRIYLPVSLISERGVILSVQIKCCMTADFMLSGRYAFYFIWMQGVQGGKYEGGLTLTCLTWCLMFEADIVEVCNKQSLMKPCVDCTTLSLASNVKHKNV